MIEWDELYEVCGCGTAVDDDLPKRGEGINGFNTYCNYITYKDTLYGIIYKLW
jgi:hypothetical protein